MVAVDREGLRDRGIAGVLELGGPSSPEKRDDRKDPLKHSSKSVFDGLTANRRSCVMCGYTEAVMHFGFDNWQLAVPRLAVCCFLFAQVPFLVTHSTSSSDVMPTRRLPRGLYPTRNPQGLHMPQVLHPCDTQEASCRNEDS